MSFEKRDIKPLGPLAHIHLLGSDVPLENFPSEQVCDTRVCLTPVVMLRWDERDELRHNKPIPPVLVRGGGGTPRRWHRRRGATRPCASPTPRPQGPSRPTSGKDDTNLLGGGDGARKFCVVRRLGRLKYIPTVDEGGSNVGQKLLSGLGGGIPSRRPRKSVRGGGLGVVAAVRVAALVGDDRAQLIPAAAATPDRTSADVRSARVKKPKDKVAAGFFGRGWGWMGVWFSPALVLRRMVFIPWVRPVPPPRGVYRCL